MSSAFLPLKNMTYEQACAELEGIVAHLESNQTTLEDAIALFERGQALAQYCTSLLEGAEVRIRRLDEGMGAQTEEE